MEHMLNCAALVAFLEGLHRLEFPDNTHDFTLPNIERRVAALERAVGGITAPPPYEAYSWNGIVWRLWRMELKITREANPDLNLYLRGMAGMLEADYTTAGLRRVVDRLGYDLPELKCPWEEDEAAAAETQEGECEACLVAVVQKLAYVGGRLRQQPPTEPLSRGIIYAFAAWLGEVFGLYGAAPNTQPGAPTWSTPSNAERAATGGDMSRAPACPDSACNVRCLAGPGYAHAGVNNSREPVSSQYNPPATAFHERNPRRNTFHHGDPRQAAFGQGMPQRTAFHPSSPRGTALNQNGSHEDAFNQHIPPAGAFDFNISPTAKPDDDSRPGLAIGTDIPRDAGVNSNVHGRVAFDPDSPYRPGFAPPASERTVPASRAPASSRPASAGSDNGGPSVPAAAAQWPRGCRWRRGVRFWRSKKAGRK